MEWRGALACGLSIAAIAGGGCSAGAIDGADAGRAERPASAARAAPATSPDLTLDPTDQSGAELGRALAGGDVNGDGYADLAVGAPGWSGEATGEGRVYVFPGGPDGLSAVAAWTVDPTDQNAAGFGRSIAMGDVNGDGFADVVAAADGWGGDAANEGRAYLFLGSAAGLAEAPAWIADPTDQDGASFGRTAAFAGDLNGDGYGDVVIGAPEWAGEATDEGRAYVYLGDAGGLADQPVLEADPTDRNEAEFSAGCGGVGDVDGDGYADLGIGAEDWDDAGSGDGEGRAYLYLGGASGPSSAPAWFTDPADQASANFGGGVASAGDVDADGLADVLIGADDWDGPAGVNEGRAYLFLGATGLPTTTPDQVLDTCDEAEANFASAVSGAGDVDGDGYADVLIGCRDYSGEASDEGRAFVFAGGPGGLSASPLWIADPTDQDGADFGGAAAGIGDVNGDGLADFAVASVFWDGEATNEGRVDVFYGRHDGTAPGRQLAQLDSDGSTALGLGATAAADAVTLTGRVTQEGPIGGRLQLEVDVARVGEPFDGSDAVRSAPVAGGSVASVTLAGLADGAYRWRSRVVYPVGTGRGVWTPFGTNTDTEADFVIASAQPAADAGPQPLADAGPASPNADASPQAPAADGELDSLYGCSGCSARNRGAAGAWWMALALAALLGRRASRANRRLRTSPYPDGRDSRGEGSGVRGASPRPQASSLFRWRASTRDRRK